MFLILQKYSITFTINNFQRFMISAKKILTIVFSCISISLYSQVTIQMEKVGGTFRIPCSINGAKMKMVFDTGASNVSLSLNMAKYLLENDYLSYDDILGSAKTSVADGRIVDNTIINIKDIEISGIHLKNIEALITETLDAPLLLGQSALQKLGSITINGNTLIINNFNKPESSNKSLVFDSETLYLDLDKWLSLSKSQSKQNEYKDKRLYCTNQFGELEIAHILTTTSDFDIEKLRTYLMNYFSSYYRLDEKTVRSMNMNNTYGDLDFERNLLFASHQVGSAITYISGTSSVNIKFKNNRLKATYKISSYDIENEALGQSRNIKYANAFPLKDSSNRSSLGKAFINSIDDCYSFFFTLAKALNNYTSAISKDEDW